MSERTEILAFARALARKTSRVPAPNRAPAETELEREIEHAFPPFASCTISPSLWNALDEQIIHKPSVGLALARILYVLSRRGDASLQVQAALGLAAALNACGEYREVREKVGGFEPLFGRARDPDALARLWLHAAWAETYLGDLAGAERGLIRARRALAGTRAAPEINWRMQWIRARILRERGNYKAALAQFQRLVRHLDRANLRIDAARVLREMAHTFARLNPAKGLPLLARARRVFVRHDAPMEIALCDYFTGQIYFALTRYRQAVAAQQKARKQFAREGLNSFAAWCDLDMGLAFWRLTEFGRASRLLERARQFFLTEGNASEVSSCEINLAGIQLDLYHFDKALPMLTRALEQALAEGRHKKAAVCYESMAWGYDKQGLYGPALESYLRARAEFETEKMVERLVMCDLYLGSIYINLGQYEHSFAVLKRAYRVAAEKKMRGMLAEIQMVRGQGLLAVKKNRRATAALKEARRRYQRLAHRVNVALCDRMLAQANPNQRAVSLRRLTSAHKTLIAQQLPVEAALTELARADLELKWGKWSQARATYERVLALLGPGFPDAAWRAAYGAGRASASLGENARALDSFLEAGRLISRVRATVMVEAESNAFIAARRQVFEAALNCALNCGQDEAALRVVEMSKAQTFLQALGDKPLPAKLTQPRAHEIGILESQERARRARLMRVRTELVAPPTGVSELVKTRPRAMAALLRRLNQTTRAYEQVITRLQLARSGAHGARPHQEFSLPAFRRMANARWGGQWAALNYMFVQPDRLCVVYVDANDVLAESVRLDAQALAALERCTATNPEQRERIYRGTINGFAVPNSIDWLAVLTPVMLPPRVQAALDACARDTQLMISPHGVLHQLPIHALKQGERFLVEQFEPAYLPNLSTLLQSAVTKRGKRTFRLLACGVAEFNGRAADLPETRREFEAVKRQNRGRVTALWGSRATRERLLEWNAKGALKQFAALHLATHAVVEQDTPQLSRILLADGDLTVMDVFGFGLDAEFVFLSGCSSGLGQGGAGDEIVGLARAFFRAGARAIVGSLWEVRDDSTAQFMARVYKHRNRAPNLGRALRRAQLELLRAGFPPYDWAGFVLLGSA